MEIVDMEWDRYKHVAALTGQRDPNLPYW
jgi:hypothetical protein